MITFCCTFQESDGHYLQGMLESLPLNSQLVLMNCIQDTENKTVYLDIVTENGLEIKRCEHHYTEWSFADARNSCHEFADNEWIYMIDADERVSFDVNRDLNLMKNIPEIVGGIFVQIVSSNFNDDGIVQVGTTTMIRLYRNNGKFKWSYRCHEKIDHCIMNEGYQLGQSDFLIRHLGYFKSNEILQEKRLRNIQLMRKDIADGFTDMKHELWYLNKQQATIQDYLKYDNIISESKTIS